jgi:hypothetical protein
MPVAAYGARPDTLDHLDLGFPYASTYDPYGANAENSLNLFAFAY